ncbi:MAG: iron ABC transporter permease [Thermoproteota archaeon]|nr:MAG: iron ABC transporter permease [Candidatus Korarchaeota archaeon]
MLAEKRRRLASATAILLAFLLLLLACYLSTGPAEVGLADAARAVLGLSSSREAEAIVLYIRLPRALGAAVVGVSLAVAGAVMQALLRNPLVDPFITGVSSGAAFGACLAMLAVEPSSLLLFYTPALAGFLGGLLAFSITMLLSRAAGESPLAMVLAGVAVSIAFSSLTTLVATRWSSKLHGVLFWVFGSLSLVSWRILVLLAPPSLALSVISLLYARELNIMLMGDEQARQLGVEATSFRRLMMAVVALLTGVCVSFTGVIGFIGLVVPHSVRMLLGGDHRVLLPASALAGASTLLAADLAARTLAQPAELPVGVVTSLLGAPFFMYLLAKWGRRYG